MLGEAKTQLNVEEEKNYNSWIFNALWMFLNKYIDNLDSGKGDVLVLESVHRADLPIRASRGWRDKQNLLIHPDLISR